MPQKKIIYVTKGTGEGLTNISAFDAALKRAGIANLNLIYLSSIIPANSYIRNRKPLLAPGDYGKRAYIVLAKAEEEIFGKEAWAGLGWCQDSQGHGLFVEHHAGSEQALVRLIKNSLKDMKKTRPDYHYGVDQYITTGIRCKNKPVCALVAALYQVESW